MKTIIFWVAVLFVSFTAAIEVTHLPMKRNLWNVVFTTLSASCANETQHLIIEVENSFPATYGTLCSTEEDGANRTLTTCDVVVNRTLTTSEVKVELNETACINLGGQFYDNYTTSGFYHCGYYNIDRSGSTTFFNIIYYPICVGASCDTSEVEAALDDIIVADMADGLLGSSIDQICNRYGPATLEPTIAPISEASNTHFSFSNIYFTFTILAATSSAIFLML